LRIQSNEIIKRIASKKTAFLGNFHGLPKKIPEENNKVGVIFQQFNHPNQK